MPVISKFYGIVVRLLHAQSLGAHIVATYGDTELVVRLWPLRIVQGDAPKRVRDLVLEWATQHQQELLSAWHYCVDGRAPVQIKPLE
jgi:hypothetical protein